MNFNVKICISMNLCEGGGACDKILHNPSGGGRGNK